MSREEVIRKSFKTYAADGKIQVSELQDIIKKVGKRDIDTVSAQRLLIFIAGPDRKMSEKEWVNGISAYLDNGNVPHAYWLLAKQEEMIKKSFKEYASDGKIQVSEIQEIIKKTANQNLDAKSAQTLLIFIAGPDRKMSEKEWVRGLMNYLRTGYIPLPYWTDENREVIRKSFKEYAADGIIEVWELQDCIRKVGGQEIEKADAQKLLIYIAGPDRRMNEKEWVNGIVAFLKTGFVPEASWLVKKETKTTSAPSNGNTIKNKRKQLKRVYIEYIEIKGKITVVEVLDSLKKIGNITIDDKLAAKLLVYISGKDKKLTQSGWVSGMREFIRTGKIPFASWMDPEGLIKESYAKYVKNGNVEISSIIELLKDVEKTISDDDATSLTLYIYGPKDYVEEKTYIDSLLLYYRSGVILFAWWTDDGKEKIQAAFAGEYGGNIGVAQVITALKKFGNKDIDNKTAQGLLDNMNGSENTKEAVESRFSSTIVYYLFSGVVPQKYWLPEVQEAIRKSFAKYASDSLIQVKEMQEVLLEFGGQITSTEHAQNILLYIAGPDRKMNDYQWTRGIIFYLRFNKDPLLYWTPEIIKLLKDLWQDIAADGKAEPIEILEAIKVLAGEDIGLANAKQLLLFIAGEDKKLSEKEWIRGMTSYLRTGLIPIPFWREEHQEKLRKSFKDYAADGKIEISEMQDVVRKFGGQDIPPPLAQQLLIAIAGKDKKMNKGEWVKGITYYLRTGKIPVPDDDDAVGVAD